MSESVIPLINSVWALDQAPELFGRMILDTGWFFKIKTRDGTIYYGTDFKEPKMFAGQWWIDFQENSYCIGDHDLNCFKVPTERKSVTLNISEIESICEAADS